MPSYVMILELGEESEERHRTLLSKIAELGDGLKFSNPDGVPYVVCFRSKLQLDALLSRVQEHLYEDDQIALMRVVEGSAVLNADSLSAFQDFLSGA